MEGADVLWELERRVKGWVPGELHPARAGGTSSILSCAVLDRHFTGLEELKTRLSC